MQALTGNSDSKTYHDVSIFGWLPEDVVTFGIEGAYGYGTIVDGTIIVRNQSSDRDATVMDATRWSKALAADRRWMA